MDKLQAMKTFVRVAETGSFSAVAHQANTTQGAVSKQVSALERELGARLLTRTTRKLSLTEEGERYFAQARRLLAEIAEAEATLRQGEQQLSGWLRVAAPVGLGRMKLMPLVQDFMAAHPAVKIDLRLSDGFVDLVEQGIDVAIRIGELPDSSMVARRISTTWRLLMAHRDYVRRMPPLRHPDDLAQHNCLIYSELATRNAWSFTAGAGAQEAAGAVVVVRAEGNLQTNSSEVMRAAILGGMGVGYSPAWLVDGELASGEVVRLLPDWEAAALPVNALYPRERAGSAKVRAFIEHMIQGLDLKPPRSP